ncbi:MAG: MBL fold metallo-hydrolase [Desulfobacteraceae bacterium]|nr:MBL fold metallo-hydrolase [Desulfobacterales bacterium]MBL6968503.1 MBL fold metallo-hydrolase [Desulfobacteraceae bacterium]MBL7102276.1 MBL fold metallo-hydrolase [Desulfobacteraceae bacterium]MBL7174041.1 MBL fold metallo-hydrolase [Desulfobacteraceae bacterium]MBU0734025.1 MBL fold metallo-hydrolase [Pseudomonadota bacterium]
MTPIEEVAANIYRMEIPLPGNPLKAVNSYVVMDSGRNLIVDTGLNRKECMDAMQAGLKALNVDLEQTDFFVTHLHADHFALVPRLVADSRTIYFNRPDAESAARGGVWARMAEYACANGFSEEESRKALERHPGHRHGSALNHALTLLDGGEILFIGGYAFTCISTPGHTRGHMCLYEPDRRILLSGDHILEDITPNIQSWSDEMQPLRSYLANLDKIHELDVDIVLPGHRRIFTRCRKRIEELKHHHKVRLEEVFEILAKGPRSAYDTASEMTWDINCKSWQDFPVAQKWFATGEALAHLKYLVEEGRLVREQRNGQFMFGRAGAVAGRSQRDDSAERA